MNTAASEVAVIALLCKMGRFKQGQTALFHLPGFYNVRNVVYRL